MAHRYIVLSCWPESKKLDEREWSVVGYSDHIAALESAWLYARNGARTITFDTEAEEVVC